MISGSVCIICYILQLLDQGWANLFNGGPTSKPTPGLDRSLVTRVYTCTAGIAATTILLFLHI